MSVSVVEAEPTTGFRQFDLGPSIQRGIAAMGFLEPRPIQSKTIPAALEGRDILGLAQTGTGTFWWRRGRVELYHEHGLGVLVVAAPLSARPYSLVTL